MIDTRFHNRQANMSIVGFSQLQGHYALDSRDTAILRCSRRLQPSHTSWSWLPRPTRATIGQNDLRLPTYSRTGPC